MQLLTNESTTTQDKVLACIRELQQPGTAYTPAPLIQQILHLIRYRKGDPADAHELLIALINDISEPISKIFQGQMSSKVQCSHCNKTTTTTENTQDISLQIATDSNTSLAEKLYDFFQPEILEGDNAYWCEACRESCRATKTLSYTHIPTILIVHLKRLILGKKIQNHTPFDTALEMEPYMALGHASSQKMDLIGIISHQGTKEHGHYVAITKKGNERTSCNDAITTQITLTHLHQLQAYVLIYKKTEHSTDTVKDSPSDVMASQQLPTKKLKVPHKIYHSFELVPQPDLMGKVPSKENPSCQGRPAVGTNPKPTQEGPTTENLKAPESSPNNHYAPQAHRTKKGEEAGGSTELDAIMGPRTLS